MANFYQIRRYIQKREEIGRKGEIRRDPSKLGLSLLNREGCRVCFLLLKHGSTFNWM